MSFNEEAAWEHAEREYPDATDDQLLAVVRAKAALYRASMAAAGLNDDEGDFIEDTPSVVNCDDWGTGEGRYHGRI